MDPSPRILFGFLSVGALNTAGTFLMFQVLVTWMPYLIAYSLCFAAGIAFSYASLSKLFSERMTLRKLARYVGAYLFLYVVGIVLFELFIRLNVMVRAVPLFVMVFTIPLSFILVRRALSPQTAS
jgi:putative flippase GtrA